MSTQHPVHYQGLNGVRAMLVIGVILLHMRLVGIGWVGIQIFFVISGFLITDILLRLRENHSLTNYLKIFYVRRTLRIFPIFYLFLSVFLVAHFIAGTGAEVSQQIKYAYLYIWNWFTATSDGPVNHDLEHFWSLAVEEQFYLLWPLVVYLIPRKHFLKSLLLLVTLGPVLRFGIVEYWGTLDMYRSGPAALYVMSFTYIDAFAMGALLVYLIHLPWALKFKPLHFCILIVVALALGMLNSGVGVVRSEPYDVSLYLGYPIHMASNYQYTWGYTVVNFLSACLLLLVMQERFLPRVFNNKLLSQMGVVSYGAYIFHLPLLHIYLSQSWVIEFQNLLGSAFWGRLILAPPFILVVFLLAELSYRYFESPFLRLKDEKFNPLRTRDVNAKVLGDTTSSN